jgi:RNA polymerase sigma factor (sigma-70 family)
MSTETGSVTMWLQGAQQGDSQSAQELWNRYIGQLIRLARGKLGRKLGPVIGSEDVAAMAFYSFLRDADTPRFPRLKDRDDLWQILVMLTEERTVDEIRRVNAKKRVPPDKLVREGDLQRGSDTNSSGLGFADMVGDAPTPEFAVEAMENLQQWLTLLGPEQQQVALLKLAGYTNKEIGEQLGRALRSIERLLTAIREIWRRESRPDTA